MASEFDKKQVSICIANLLKKTLSADITGSTENFEEFIVSNLEFKSSAISFDKVMSYETQKSTGKFNIKICFDIISNNEIMLRYFDLYIIE